MALATVGIASHAAPAQETPPVSQQWVDRQYQTDSGTGQPVNAADEATDVVFYHYDPPGQPNNARRWVYATGYVTESNGATRFLTTKYNADYPELFPSEGLVLERVEWPLLAPASGQVNKAVAMTVDYDGNIYIAGESTDLDAGQTGVDYVVLKYDKDLNASSIPPGTPSWVYRYDGPAHGNDRPADIIVDHQQTGVLIVTGTSWNGTNNDIVTIALDAATGVTCPIWPASAGEAKGVRRYDGGGEDTGVELAGPNIACYEVPVPGSCSDMMCELQVGVLGTSWDTATQTFDMLTFKYGDRLFPVLEKGVVLWQQRWMGGGDQNELATGLAWNGARLISLGYGPPSNTFSAPSSGSYSFGPASTPNHDYHLVVYDYIDGAIKFSDTVDLTGDADYSADVQAAPYGLHDFLFWATGRATSGSVFDVGTVQWTWVAGPTESLTRNWVALYDVLAGRDDRAVNMAFEAGVTNAGYLTGSTTGGSVTNNDTLTVKYPQTPAPPARAPAWTILHAGASGGEDAGRAIAVGDQNTLAAQSSVYIAGKSFKTSQDLDFIVVRYKQP